MMSLSLMAVFSGVLWALMGISIRMGTARGAHLSQLYVVISFAGFVLFTVRAVGAPSTPLLTVCLAVTGGLSQYAGLFLLRKALHRGPITAIWSAVSLGFLPVSVYSIVALKEPLSCGGVASLLIGVACVLCAARLQEEPGAKHSPARRQTGFAALLFSLLLLNGLLSVFIKHLTMLPSAGGSNGFVLHQDSFMALVYAVLLTCLALEQWRGRQAWANPVPTLVAGGTAACGSMGGLWLIGRVAHLPAAIVFTASSMAQIAVTFLLATLLIGEKRTGVWYATLGLALSSIVASQAESLLRWMGR
jgi:hypothetical protein